MRTGIRFRSLPALAAVLLGTSPALADGVLLSRFEPSDRGSRFFYADSLELGRRDPVDPRPLVSAGVTSSYAFTTTTWGNHREGKRDSLVKDALWVHPGASLTLYPGVRFGIDVPVAAYQFGEDTNLDGSYYLAPSSPRIGDIRATFELKILGPQSSDTPGFALSGGVGAWLPTGSAANYAGDDFTRFGIHVAGRWRVDSFLAAARVGYMYRRDTYVGGSRVGPEVNANAGLAWLYENWTVGPEITMSSAIDSEFAKRSTPVEVLLGAHADIGGGFRAGGGIGTALVKGMGASDLRVVLSIEWRGPDAVSERDRDRDGFPDRLDLCPEVPGAERGCPNGPMTPDVIPAQDPEAPGPEPAPTIVPPPVVEPPPPPPPAPEEKKSETP